MMVTTKSGDIFESECDLIDATSLHRPDTNWRHVDIKGHEHRWHTDGKPAASYRPDVHYEVPSLVVVHDGWGYWEDGERYRIWHYECRQCRRRVEPGYTADTHTQHVPGLRRYRINGEPVSEEEFRRRAAEALKHNGG